MSKKQAHYTNGDTTIKANSEVVKESHTRLIPEPKENPKLQAARKTLHEENLENLFSFLHATNKSSKKAK